MDLMSRPTTFEATDASTDMWQATERHSLELKAACEATIIRDVKAAHEVTICELKGVHQRTASEAEATSALAAERERSEQALAAEREQRGLLRP